MSEKTLGIITPEEKIVILQNFETYLKYSPDKGKVEEYLERCFKKIDQRNEFLTYLAGYFQEFDPGQKIEFLTYTQWKELYPAEYALSQPKPGIPMPFFFLTDPSQIKECEIKTGMIFFVVRFAFVTFVAHPKATFKEDGTIEFGIQYEIQTKAHREGRAAQIVVPVFTDENGIKRVPLQLQSRLTENHIGGKGVEISSSAQRPGVTPIESALIELKAEVNFTPKGEPVRLDPAHTKGCPQLPGTASEVSQVYYVEAEPLPGINIEVMEGIKGRLLLTKQEYKAMIMAGTYVHTFEDGTKAEYVTTLMHNVVAYWWLEAHNIW